MGLEKPRSVLPPDHSSECQPLASSSWRFSVAAASSASHALKIWLTRSSPFHSFENTITLEASVRRAVGNERVGREQRGNELARSLERANYRECVGV
jgi:hypothetical protein